MEALSNYKKCDTVAVLKFELWISEESLIPYLGEVVFSTVPIRGWMVDPYGN